MIGGKRVLGLITARGGSQGIPGKNVKPLAGKPMIAWTIEAALACSSIDHLILSSDDREIIAIARVWGCDVPFIRPPALATADARSIDVIHHAMDQVGAGYDYLVLLQPTSPLRLAADIDHCVAECLRHHAPACISVSPSTHSTSVLVTLRDDGRMARLMDVPTAVYQRQQLPTPYVINGAIYVAQWAWLRQAQSFMCEDTVAYRMPRERSVDIDEPMDLVIAEALLRSRDQPA